MTAPVSPPQGAVDLDTVIATAALAERPARRSDAARKTALLLSLMRDLALAPEAFFQKLVEAVLELSNAESSGISLLNEGAKAFVWPAVAGPFRVYLAGHAQRFRPVRHGF